MTSPHERMRPLLALGSLVVFLLVVTAAPAAAVVVRACDAEPTTNMTVQYGDLITCAIATTGDVDSFRFAGRPGDHVLILALPTGGDSGAPCVVVTDPQSNEVGSDCASSGSTVELFLTKTGNYTITVNENANSEVIDYSLLVAAHPQRPCTPDPTDMTIGYRDPVICDIPISGGTDIFRFPATSGDSVVVSVVRLAGGGTPCLTLKNPSGTVIEGPTCSTTATIGAGISSTGTYRVDVSNSSSSQASIYALGVHCAPRSCGN